MTLVILLKLLQKNLSQLFFEEQVEEIICEELLQDGLVVDIKDCIE